MSNFIYYERIEAYVEGHLAETDRQQFERELAENEALKAEYDAYLATLQVIDTLAYEQLREKAAALAGRREARQFFIGRRALRVAAAVLLLIVAGSFWYANQNYSDRALFTANYQAPAMEQIRGESAAETTYQQAALAYQAQDYPRAIDLLSSIPAEAANYAPAQYLLGHSYLADGQAQRASATFEALLAQQDKRYTENVQWSLVLASLQEGNQAALRERLDRILADPAHPYFPAATELDDQLNSFWRGLSWRRPLR